MKIKKVALVGLGGISRTHLYHLKNSSSFEVCGGVDLAEAQRKAFSEENGLPAYTALETLLAEQEVDGLIIATPPSTREPLITLALDRGIAILSEKPLAANFETAERIAAHPNAKRQLRVGYCHRWTGASQAALRMLAEGQIGTPVSFSLCFSGWMPAMQSHWMTEPSLSGGGAMIDNGCHALDLFAYLCGGVASVEGSVRRSWPGRGEDSFAIVAQSPKGTLGLLSGSYLHSAPRNEWELVGTEGTLRYSYDKEIDKLFFHKAGEIEATVVPSPSLRFATQIEEWSRVIDGRSSTMATAQEGASINRWLESLL